MVSKEVDVNFVYNKWLNEISEDIYNKANRKGYLRSLFDNFVKYQVDYETALSYKRQVMKDLITEDGKKNTNKRTHKHYMWLQNIESDFGKIITEFYDPNKGLIVENVVFRHSKFQLPDNENIKNWVIENYGDSPDLIEQAHNVNSALCIEYHNELERTVNE